MRARLSDADLDSLFAPVSGESRIALAVSGGGDSMALLHLAQSWARRRGVGLLALTVDHGLRTESAAEAATVADFCRAQGINHEILHWAREEGARNLSDAARSGRYRAMASACARHGLSTLLTGHTLDDQAETVLMRLARGSGVDGLAGMRPMAALWNLRLFRPLLGLRRTQLRDVLRDAGIPWAEDPTNEDRGYTRIQARDMLPQLASLGLTPERLAATATMMHDASAVLRERAAALESGACTHSLLGYVLLDPAPLAQAPRETVRRLMAGLLCRVSGATYRPRLKALVGLLGRLQAPDFQGATLHGCRLYPRGTRIAIQREPQACATVSVPAQSGVWDGRFDLEISPAIAGFPDSRIDATGEAGLRQLKALDHVAPPDWTAAPRSARLCTPALWQGDKLLAVPLADYVIAPGLCTRCVLLPPEPFSSMVDPADEAYIY